MRTAFSPSAWMVSAPFALHRVKCQQVRGGGRAAFDFVEVHHLQAVAGARLFRKRSAPRPAPNAAPNGQSAHAIDSDPHAAPQFNS